MNKLVRKEFDSIPTGRSNACRFDTFTHRELALLLILSIVVIIFFGFVFYSATLEDAFITFRYSEHLAEGYGLGAWNTDGERVEGYSSLLWMLLLGLAHYKDIDVRTASKIVGLFSQIVLTFLLVIIPLLSKRKFDDPDDVLANTNESVLAGVFLAFYIPLSYYATSGMETVFFTTLVALFTTLLFLKRSSFLIAIVAIILILTRPEGMLIASVGIGFNWIQKKIEGQPLLDWYVASGIVLVTIGALLIHRLVLYNEIVPNTYWAKVSGGTSQHVMWGFKYIFLWIRSHIIIALISAVAVVRLFFFLTKDKVGGYQINFGYILLMLFIFTVYIIKIGGDNTAAFPFWRHFIHISPLIGLLMGYVITRMMPQTRHLQLFILFVIILATNGALLGFDDGSLVNNILMSLSTFPTLSHEAHNPYYIWLKEFTQDNTTIASSLGGELPYLLDAIHIDILGLNNRHVAKYGHFDPNGPPDSKTDMSWVLEQRPDIIEGFISAKQIINDVPATTIIDNWRYQMNRELVSSIIFQQEYLFVLNGPYEHLDRALFFRRSICMNHPRKDELNCIPMSETTLGLYGSTLRNKSLNAYIQ